MIKVTHSIYGYEYSTEMFAHKDCYKYILELREEVNKHWKEKKKDVSDAAEY